MKYNYFFKVIGMGPMLLSSGAFLSSRSEETTQQPAVSIADDCKEGICGFKATPSIFQYSNESEEAFIHSSIILFKT
ncbi:MAG: hypothetical protein ACI8TE_000722 [Francisella sp.]|jgi:hypothetical protein